MKKRQRATLLKTGTGRRVSAGHPSLACLRVVASSIPPTPLIPWQPWPFPRCDPRALHAQGRSVSFQARHYTHTHTHTHTHTQTRSNAFCFFSLNLPFSFIALHHDISSRHLAACRPVPARYPGRLDRGCHDEGLSNMERARERGGGTTPHQRRPQKNKNSPLPASRPTSPAPTRRSPSSRTADRSPTMRPPRRPRPPARQASTRASSTRPGRRRGPGGAGRPRGRPRWAPTRMAPSRPACSPSGTPPAGPPC